MKLTAKQWFLAGVGVLATAAGTYTAFFMPARIGYNLADKSDLVCAQGVETTQRTLTYTGYLLTISNRSASLEHTNFGTCAYEEYHLRTYGGEFWGLALLALAGTLAINRKVPKKED